MKWGKKKGPRTLVPPAEKTPRQELNEDWQQMRPAWRFSLVEVVDPYGWHEIAAGDAARVRDRLAGFESSTWKQILYQGGYRNHLIRRDRLCAAAQARLQAIGQDDIDSVMSLGVTQMERVFGIMDHNVMKILWWDPNHQVCPAGDG